MSKTDIQVCDNCELEKSIDKFYSRAKVCKDCSNKKRIALRQSKTENNTEQNVLSEPENLLPIEKTLRDRIYNLYTYLSQDNREFDVITTQIRDVNTGWTELSNKTKQIFIPLKTSVVPKVVTDYLDEARMLAVGHGQATRNMIKLLPVTRSSDINDINDTNKIETNKKIFSYVYKTDPNKLATVKNYNVASSINAMVSILQYAYENLVLKYNSARNNLYVEFSEIDVKQQFAQYDEVTCKFIVLNPVPGCTIKELLNQVVLETKNFKCAFPGLVTYGYTNTFWDYIDVDLSDLEIKPLIYPQDFQKQITQYKLEMDITTK